MEPPTTAGEAVDIPLFEKDVTLAIHESGLSTLGVGSERSLVQPLTKSVKDAQEKMPFAT